MNLFALWTESYGEALKVANNLALQGGHIVDCSIIGKWSQVLVQFNSAAQASILKDVDVSGPHKKVWLPNLKEKAVESYLSLSTQDVKDFILSVECEFVGDAFEFLQQIDLETFPIVDFRLLRFSQPKTILILTGKQEQADALLVILENLKAHGKAFQKAEMIRPISDGIKSLYSYS